MSRGTRLIKNLEGEADGDVLAANTPPQFDASKLLATTEFVQRALGNFQSIVIVTTNTTLTAAQTGSIIQVSGAGVTVTLPAPTTARLHYRIYNSDEVNSFVISTPSGVLHRGGQGAATTTIPSAGSMDVYSDGLNWIMSNGWSKSALAASGYQRLPSGLVIQWGSATIGATSNLAITLPTPFLVATYVAFANYVNTGGDGTAANQIAQVRTMTNTTLTLRNLGSAGNTFFWVAIGV
jgi:hypothetical protein